MTLTRTQATLLKQTIDALNMGGGGGGGSEGGFTGLLTVQSENFSLGNKLILDIGGPIIVYGVILFKQTGGSNSFQVLDDGSVGGPRKFHMGGLSLGETHSIFPNPGVRFATNVSMNGTNSGHRIQYTIFYTPG